MLLDEDPASLISECIGNFNIAPDRSVLSRISASLSHLKQHRSQQTSTHESNLKRTTRALHSLEQQHSITLSSHNPTEHAEEILRLDSDKFRVAKEASDLEIEGERLDGELQGLRRQLEAVEGGSNGDWEGREDELMDVLRLKLYRSLGIDADESANGQIERALVRKPEMVKVVQFDAKVPKAQYVDQFWDAL